MNKAYNLLALLILVSGCDLLEQNQETTEPITLCQPVGSQSVCGSDITISKMSNSDIYTHCLDIQEVCAQEIPKSVNQSNYTLYYSQNPEMFLEQNYQHIRPTPYENTFLFEASDNTIIYISDDSAVVEVPKASQSQIDQILLANPPALERNLKIHWYPAIITKGTITDDTISEFTLSRVVMWRQLCNQQAMISALEEDLAGRSGQCALVKELYYVDESTKEAVRVHFERQRVRDHQSLAETILEGGDNIGTTKFYIDSIGMTDMFDVGSERSSFYIASGNYADLVFFDRYTYDEIGVGGSPTGSLRGYLDRYSPVMREITDNLPPDNEAMQIVLNPIY